MRERAPIDVAFARRNLLRPAEYRQIVFDRMVPKPVDPVLVVDPGFLFRIPDFDGPGEATKMLVDPVEGTGDVLVRVILKFVPDRNRGVPGELLAALAQR